MDNRFSRRRTRGLHSAMPDIPHVLHISQTQRRSSRSGKLHIVAMFTKSSHIRRTLTFAVTFPQTVTTLTTTQHWLADGGRQPSTQTQRTISVGHPCRSLGPQPLIVCAAPQQSNSCLDVGCILCNMRKAAHNNQKSLSLSRAYGERVREKEHRHEVESAREKATLHHPMGGKWVGPC